jgi:non-ribosomal peptide synthetase component E (peptide arylation enzyme)
MSDLQEAIRKRDQLLAKKNRHVVRLEQVQEEQREMERKIHDRGIDPQKLPEKIEEIRLSLKEKVEKFQSDLDVADDHLKRFEEAL